MESDITMLHDKLFSFLLGIIVVFLFWVAFKPRYVVIKNGKI